MVAPKELARASWGRVVSIRLRSPNDGKRICHLYLPYSFHVQTNATQFPLEKHVKAVFKMFSNETSVDDDADDFEFWLF